MYRMYQNVVNPHITFHKASCCECNKITHQEKTETGSWTTFNSLASAKTIYKGLKFFTSCCIDPLPVTNCKRCGGLE